MIRRIFSTLPTFKTLTLRPGLNVLLADKTEQSTQRQTRNSAGKSSIVEIVHFLLGASVGKKSIFLHEALRDHTFGIDVELAGVLVSVSRSGRAQNLVRLQFLGGDLAAWPTTLFATSTEVELPLKEWTEVLGRVVFRVPTVAEGSSAKYRPTFRSMFSYFARRVSAGAFQQPIAQGTKQSPWDQQVMVSYLLGLDWELVGESQRLRDRVKGLKALKKAAGEELDTVVGRKKDLFAQLTNLEDQIAARREAVAGFRVLPTFEEHSTRAERLTQSLIRLRNQQQADSRRLEILRRALETETAPEIPDVARLYEEAGVALPDVALRRFADVRAFHAAVVSNRRDYLQVELMEAESRLQRCAAEMEQIERRRADSYRILQSGGALEDLSMMQRDLADKESTVVQLRNRYETAKSIDATQKEIKAAKAMLVVQLQRATAEHEAVQKRAISIISRVFMELYGNSGALTLDATEAGLEIAVRCNGDRGRGIGQMSIFAFDLMLALICAERSIGPGFVIHDSHLFDGVDGRQLASALMIGQRELAAIGQQYLVLLNSDELPAPDDRPEGFDISTSILDVRLTDATETGGLFGIRFD